jgi:hypothetical protein
MSAIFKLTTNTNFSTFFGDTFDSIGMANESLAPLPIPATNTGIVNVVNDFKWTKTLKEGRYDIPFLYMKEWYVVQPGIVSNLATIKNIGVETLTDIFSRFSTSINSDTLDAIKSYITNNIENSDFNQASAKVANQIIGSSITKDSVITSDKKYLEPFKALYGLRETKFVYYLPYFTEDWKTIGNTWIENQSITDIIPRQITAGNVLNIKSTIEGIASTLSKTGFNIDFAKNYSYGENTPSATIQLVLDNTYDGLFDAAKSSSWQQNWEFIFLLLYQNLPNRRNRFYVEPPVLYRAKVNGVFSFIYSYIKGITVKAEGTKKMKNIKLNVDGNVQEYQVLIPEAFNIVIELQSLLPENKNLFFDSLENKVTVGVE